MMKLNPTFLSRAVGSVRSRAATAVRASARLRAPVTRTIALGNDWTTRTTTLQTAFFSSGSHDDFAPQRKAVDGEDEALKMIEEHVTANPIMLYMKGSPNMPMCGFSAKVVQVLQSQGVDFASVNVLDYPSIRDGVKKFSQWPTIPQLYVNGEFIGGCDIVMAMHESGELAELFKETKTQEE